MNSIYWTIAVDLPVRDAVRRMEKLLGNESVRFIVDENAMSITSTRIPFPMIGIDMRLYSRKNWVGVNPFVFVSGIEIAFVKTGRDSTRLDVSIDLRRTLVLYCCMVVILLLVAASFPAWWVGFLFLVLASGILHQVLFRFLAKHLIGIEILYSMQTTRSARI